MKISSDNKFLNIKGIYVYNQIIDGYFTVGEAIDYAKSLGMRLPTYLELKYLIENACWKCSSDKSYIANSIEDLEYENSRITLSNYGFLDFKDNFETLNTPNAGYYWVSETFETTDNSCLVIDVDIHKYRPRMSHYDRRYKHSIILVKL